MEVEPPPVEERRRRQEELSEFVESCCRTLEEVTASLGWSLDRLDPGEAEAAEVRGGRAGAFEALSLRSSLAAGIGAAGGASAGPWGARAPAWSTLLPPGPALGRPAPGSWTGSAPSAEPRA